MSFLKPILMAWGRNVMLTIFGLALVVTTITCTPYPMYNHRIDDPIEVSDSDQEEPADRSDDNGSEFHAANVTDGTRDQPPVPSTVDPRVFERVVEDYLGIPYSLGGDDHDGIDCSNLVSTVYRDYAAKRLPRSTRSLFRLPIKLSQEELQVGDLVFFSFTGSRSPDHVGLYMGNGRFVHASESRGVIYSSIATPYYRDAYRGARRVM